MSWRGEARHSREAFWVRTSHKGGAPGAADCCAAPPHRALRAGPDHPRPGPCSPGAPRHALASLAPPLPFSCSRCRARPAATSCPPGPARPGPSVRRGAPSKPRDTAGHHGTRSPRRAAVRTPPARQNYKSQSASRAHRMRCPAMRDCQAPTNTGV